MNRSLPVRRPNRLRDYDYSESGGYFVTIASAHRAPVFGYVQEGIMHRGRAGDSVLSVWLDLPARFPSVTIDEFIVMPDHLHGIVFLPGQAGAMNLAPTLGEIVRVLKAASTWQLRRSGYPDFAWQRNYYEHVVRNEADLARVREYIRNNPAAYMATGEEPALQPPIRRLR